MFLWAQKSYSPVPRAVWGHVPVATEGTSATGCPQAIHPCGRGLVMIKKKTFSVKNSTYRHNLKPSPSFLPKGKVWVGTFICPTLNFTPLNSDPARTSCSALKKVPAHPRSQHKSQAEKWLPWHPDLLPDYYSGHSPSFSLNLEEGAVIL